MLIDFVPVRAAAWPPQQFGPAVLSHSAENTQSPPKSKSPILKVKHTINNFAAQFPIE